MKANAKALIKLMNIFNPYETYEASTWVLYNSVLLIHHKTYNEHSEYSRVFNFVNNFPHIHQ
jgi:hypothetical protein